MKIQKIFFFLLATVVAVGFLQPTAPQAAVAAPKVGDAVRSLPVDDLKAAGYTFIDNTDESVGYTWPYTLDTAFVEAEDAYGGSYAWQIGQVSATLNTRFAGTYVAIAFAETYLAAEIKISIDGQHVGTVTPFNADGNTEEKREHPLTSKIVFVKDDLEPGVHALSITHAAGHTSGEENEKGGKKYYDNNAFFDCVISKGSAEGSSNVTEMTLDSLALKYTPDVLDKLDLKAIDCEDESIVYTWPFDLENAATASAGAYDQTIRSNLGQVGASIEVDFEGTFLALAFAETWYACEIMVDVDGEELASIIPHTDTVRGADMYGTSKIVFLKDDLAPGEHTLSIFLAAAYTTGEDNIKGDGNPFYDNECYFDALFVQKNPTQPTKAPVTAEPTVDPHATATPAPTKAPTAAPTAVPLDAGEEEHSSIVLPIVIAVVVVAIVAVIVAVVLKKRKK